MRNQHLHAEWDRWLEKPEAYRASTYYQVTGKGLPFHPVSPPEVKARVMKRYQEKKSKGIY